MLRDTREQHLEESDRWNFLILIGVTISGEVGISTALSWADNILMRMKLSIMMQHDEEMPEGYLVDM